MNRTMVVLMSIAAFALGACGGDDDGNNNGGNNDGDGLVINAMGMTFGEIGLLHRKAVEGFVSVEMSDEPADAEAVVTLNGQRMAYMDSTPGSFEDGADGSPLSVGTDLKMKIEASWRGKSASLELACPENFDFSSSVPADSVVSPGDQITFTWTGDPWIRDGILDKPNMFISGFSYDGMTTFGSTEFVTLTKAENRNSVTVTVPDSFDYGIVVNLTVHGPVEEVGASTGQCSREKSIAFHGPNE